GRTADDTEDLGGRSLLLQAFAQLVEQPRVLDGDDGLGGEVLNQLYLFVGERADFLTIDDDCANQLVFLEHGNGNQGSCASRLDQSDNAGITSDLGLIRGEIGNMQYFFAPTDAGEWIVRVLARDVRTPPHALSIIRRQAERCCRMERATVVTEQYTKCRFADAYRIPQHGLEHRLQFTRRRADDLEYLRGRGLLFQRLAQLVEQPCVLDGNDGLRSEVLDQLDLLVGEGLDFLTEHVDRADQLIVLEHRNGQYGPITAEFDGRDDKWLAIDVGLHHPGVSDLGYLLRGRDKPKGAVRGWSEDSIARAGLGVGRRRIVHRHGAESFALAEIEGAEFRFADARGILQHRLKHRLQFARRAADDLEHVRGGGLLLQRFAQLVEQPGILDGDHGLL